MLNKNENIYIFNQIFLPLFLERKEFGEILGLTESHVEILITHIELMVFHN